MANFKNLSALNAWVDSIEANSKGIPLNWGTENKEGKLVPYGLYQDNSAQEISYVSGNSAMSAYICVNDTDIQMYGADIDISKEECNVISRVGPRIIHKEELPGAFCPGFPDSILKERCGIPATNILLTYARATNVVAKWGATKENGDNRKFISFIFFDEPVSLLEVQSLFASVDNVGNDYSQNGSSFRDNLLGSVETSLDDAVNLNIEWVVQTASSSISGIFCKDGDGLTPFIGNDYGEEYMATTLIATPIDKGHGH